MNTHPKMLKVETGYLDHPHHYLPDDEYIDYRVYQNVPRWWRWIEKTLRLDLYLAYRAKAIANQFDIIWANSEKVAVPLSFLNLKKPMVVILQYPESPLRVLLIRMFGLAKHWSGVGIVSRGARGFLESKLGIDRQKIFQYFAIKTDVFYPAAEPQLGCGHIFSIGVAKRDYTTLIEALAELPGYQTDIHASSKYGDLYNGRKIARVPDWIHFPGRIPEQELLNRYQACRFAVVPLQPTLHSGAGVTSVLEASACGKAVITTHTGGMDSYVVHGKTGLLVPPKDPRAMRDAIRTLWENEDLAAEMGKAGRKFVEENYNHDQVFCEIVDFLHSISKNGTQRPK